MKLVVYEVYVERRRRACTYEGVEFVVVVLPPLVRDIEDNEFRN